jgi:uncharacterized protein YndB with AHSA1/START domain
MALHNIFVAAPPDAVWEILADPYSYSEWVVGTREILSADPSWPEVCSLLRYRAGIGPVRFEGHSIVREVDAPRRLELEADAKLMGARVSLSLKPWADGALAVVEEHWIRGPSMLLDNPLVDLALTIRNRWMVRNLASVVERRCRRT